MTVEPGSNNELRIEITTINIKRYKPAFLKFLFLKLFGFSFANIVSPLSKL